MKKVIANWDLSLIAECPKCGNYDDLVSYGMVDCPWEEFGTPLKSDKNINYVHTCTECGEEFLITETCR